MSNAPGIAGHVHGIAGLTGGLVDLISSQTASSSASIDFDAVFDSSYDYYEIHWFNVVPATDDTGLTVRISQDGGSTYKSGASDYVWVGTFSREDNDTVSNDRDTADDRIYLTRNTTTFMMGSTSNEAGSGLVRVWHPQESGELTKISFESTYQAAQTALHIVHGAGHYVTDTNAIDSIQFLMSSGNIASGTFRLYGVKNSALGVTNVVNAASNVGRFDSALGSVTSPQTITHSLGQTRVSVIVIDSGTSAEVEVDVSFTDANNLDISGWSGSRNLSVTCIG